MLFSLVLCVGFAALSSTDLNSNPLGAPLDPLNLVSLPMVKQVIAKSCPGFDGVAEGEEHPGLESSDWMRP
jgi:hypothetical protein